MLSSWVGREQPDDRQRDPNEVPRSFADYPAASALSVILLVTLLVAMAVYARAFGTRTMQEHVG